MFDIFATVDGDDKNAGVTEDDDSRISLDEFLDHWQSLSRYGFKALEGIDSVEKATAIFNAIDTNDGGFILFKEWSDYIKDKEISAKTHIGTLLSGNLTPTKISDVAKTLPTHTKNGANKSPIPPKQAKKPVVVRTEIPKSRVSTAGSFRSTASTSPFKVSNNINTTVNIKSQMKLSPSVEGVYKPTNASKELKDFLKSFQPYTEKNEEAKKLRKLGFKKCDTNGSGKCSLAEIDLFVLTNLQDDHGPKLGEKLFKSFRPCYIVAYNGAKNLKSNAKGNDDDYINFSEFRVLNVYLCIYAGMFDAFSTIDGGGSGITKDDDRRIDKKEWLKGYVHVKTSGFVALGKLADKNAAVAAFETMDDDDKSGRVVFKDFCQYLSSAEMSAGTKMGAFFSENGLQPKSFQVARDAMAGNTQGNFLNDFEESNIFETKTDSYNEAADEIHDETEDVMVDELHENEVQEAVPDSDEALIENEDGTAMVEVENEEQDISPDHEEAAIENEALGEGADDEEPAVVEVGDEDADEVHDPEDVIVDDVLENEVQEADPEEGDNEAVDESAGN
jgi:hypothetical protein